MILSLGKGRPVRISVGEVAVVGASKLQARRLADAFPAALHRALLAIGETEGRREPIDRAARDVADQIRRQVERRS